MNNKKIQVIGPDSPVCKKFLANVEKIVKELEIELPVEYVVDSVNSILVIDDKTVLSGLDLGEKEIHEALIKACFLSLDERGKENNHGCAGCQGCGRC